MERSKLKLWSIVLVLMTGIIGEINAQSESKSNDGIRQTMNLYSKYINQIDELKNNQMIYTRIKVNSDYLNEKSTSQEMEIWKSRGYYHVKLADFETIRDSKYSAIIAHSSKKIIISDLPDSEKVEVSTTLNVLEKYLNSMSITDHKKEGNMNIVEFSNSESAGDKIQFISNENYSKLLKIIIIYSSKQQNDLKKSTYSFEESQIKSISKSDYQVNKKLFLNDQLKTDYKNYQLIENRYKKRNN